MAVAPTPAATHTQHDPPETADDHALELVVIDGDPGAVGDLLTGPLRRCGLRDAALLLGPADDVGQTTIDPCPGARRHCPR